LRAAVHELTAPADAGGMGLSVREAAGVLAQSVGGQTVGGDLTAREREVLAVVAAELSNARIAERLSVARTTVRLHLGAILG
jgi:ATP/maltotriose-dependent transcriptional regulator MalT